MNEDEHLAAFGLRPRAGDLPAVRALLMAETALESAAQGGGDGLLMKLCCIQLFNSGDLTDTLPIWRAKRASFDTACSIDIQLLCGSGLEQTKAYLLRQASAEAQAALLSLIEYEAAGAFDGFSPEGYAGWWDHYYYDEEGVIRPS